MSFSAPYALFVGTYTDDQGKGIYRYEFFPDRGELRNLQLVAESTNPSYLAAAQGGRFLYAVNEVDDHAGLEQGAVSAYAIGQDGADLTRLCSVPSHGSHPCHVVANQAATCLIVANYGSGTLCSFPVQTSGVLSQPATVHQMEGASVVTGRQESPHAHFACFSPDQRFVLACDLGSDKILTYRFEKAVSRLVLHSTFNAREGSGPRHLVFGPDSASVFVINELDNTVAVLSYNEQRGTLKEEQRAALHKKAGTEEKAAAAIVMDTEGKFLYASERGKNAITVFRIDRATGLIELIQEIDCGGVWPRFIDLDPTQAWLLVANQRSNEISCFQRDQQTGRLAWKENFSAPSPAAAVFVRR